MSKEVNTKPKRVVSSLKIRNFGKRISLESQLSSSGEEDEKMFGRNDAFTSNSRSNSDSGYPSASSDDDTQDLFVRSRPNIARQNSLDVQSMKYRCNPVHNAEVTQTPRIQRSVNYVNTNRELSNGDKDESDNQEVVSNKASDCTTTSRRTHIDRIVGRLRRGSDNVYRSGTDNVVPLYLNKSYERPTLDIKSLRRGSTPIIMGSKAPKIDDFTSRRVSVPVNTSGLRKTSSSSTEGFQPISDGFQPINKTNAVHFQSETLKRLRSLSTTDNDTIKIKANHRFRTTSDVTAPRRLSDARSDFTNPYNTDIPMEVEMKTKVKNQQQKITVERTVAGSASPKVKRVGRTGITFQSLPSSRETSPTGMDSDIDRELALAFKKAFEDASWRYGEEL